MEQVAFEHGGHARPNILASKIAALTLVGAFAITGCASGEQDNDRPDIQQISTSEGIDISGLDEEGQSLFGEIETSVIHDGTLAGLSSAAEYSQTMFGGANSEQFNDLTVEINGRDVNCGVVENIWFISDEMPTNFESADFDPTQYERACSGYMSNLDLGLFIPYMVTMKEVIEEDDVLDKMQPELAAGLIQDTGHQLLTAKQNSSTLEDIVDEVAYVAESWTGSGYVPNRDEVADIVNTAMKNVYGVTQEVLPDGQAEPAAPVVPAPAEATQPAIEPEVETDVSSELGVAIDPNAAHSLLLVQDAFKDVSKNSNDAKVMTYYSAATETFLTCAEYLKHENCSDVQAAALYAAANTSNTLYGLGIASPADLQALTVYSLLMQANDPELRAEGGLKTYTLDLLTTDVQSQLHREAPETEVKSVVSETVKLLGISLPKN